MVYKLISDWRSPNGLEHEVRIYKYNLNHDELVIYFKTGSNELKINTHVLQGKHYEEIYDLRDGEKKWYNYNTMQVII